MRIDYQSYSDYISKLSASLKDRKMFSPVLINNETFIFPFVENKNESLVISLNHSSPLLYIVNDERFHSSFELPFFLRLKKLLSNSQIKNISIKENDFVVNISLHVENEFCEDDFSLFVELIPTKPNIILLDKDSKIIEAFYKDKNRLLTKGENYVFPKQLLTYNQGEKITAELITSHFENELEQRRKERYRSFLNYINGKIKQSNRKIIAIENDVILANKNLKYEDIANNMFCLGIDLKSHLDKVAVNNEIITLDSSKSVLQNIEHFYKIAKKAKETLSRSKTNIENAKKDISEYQLLLIKFNNSNEKEADKLMEEIGMVKKKKEIKETSFNKPYKINLNGTLIYFGRNASQNDCLSFVMKLDREFAWMHIKDKSGAHIVIANTKPTEKEILFAAELALLCSKAQAGEVIYTKKKNVRRGHTLGEAILKNHSTIKINSVSNETKDIFETAERLK